MLYAHIIHPTPGRGSSKRRALVTNHVTGERYWRSADSASLEILYDSGARSATIGREGIPLLRCTLYDEPFTEALWYAVDRGEIAIEDAFAALEKRNAA